MNAENLLTVRSAILADVEHYDQQDFLHSCGTPSCVAGYAAACAGWKGVPRLRAHQIVLVEKNGTRQMPETVATEYLDLTRYEAITMFQAMPFNPRLHTKPQEAAAMLERAAETGEVKWVAIPGGER